MVTKRATAKNTGGFMIGTLLKRLVPKAGISALRLCRAATAIQLAISAMSASTATGGVLRNTMPAMPSTGTWVTTSRVSSGTTTIRATCGVFVASKIKKTHKTLARGAKEKI